MHETTTNVETLIGIRVVKELNHDVNFATSLDMK